MDLNEKIEMVMEDYDLPTADEITLEKICEFQEAALECISGIGDSYAVMASVIALGEALKSKLEK